MNYTPTPCGDKYVSGDKCSFFLDVSPTVPTNVGLISSLDHSFDV